MKNWFKRLTAALAVSMLLVMTLGSSVFAANSGPDSHFDFACGGQFTMHPGETKEITWFCDDDYSVYTTQSTSSKTVLASNGLAGNNTGTIRIASDEQSSRVVFYFYPNDDPDNYDSLVVDIAPNNFTTAVTSDVPGFAGYAQTTDGTHTLLYNAQGQPLADFAVYGNNSFEQVSLGNFVTTANGIYLTVNTPLNTSASLVSISQADEATARSLGINGLILNNRTVNWP